jgi:hypothetical protein
MGGSVSRRRTKFWTSWNSNPGPCSIVAVLTKSQLSIIMASWPKAMVIPTDSVNGRDGSENPRVPLVLTAATRNWYQCPGRSEFFRVTLVRVDRCRATQLLRRAAEKWRPTWCLSSSRNSTGLPYTDGPWDSANHSTTTVRPLRRSVTDRFVGTGGRPAVCPRINVNYWFRGYEV